MSHYDPSQPPPSQWQRPDARIQTEWQQQSSKPLPQPSIQSPRPPTRKVRGKLNIVIGVVVTLIAILGVIFAGHSNPSHPAKSAIPVSAKLKHRATQVVMTPTPQPVLVIQVIGKPVVVDSIWTITLNGVKTSLGDAFSPPEGGNVYLVVDVTVKNTSTHYQDMLSGNQLVLRDSAGQQYVEAITDFATPPDGSIKPGASQRGQLAYEIPTTMHTFSYYFQADTKGTDLTEWILHV